MEFRTFDPNALEQRQLTLLFQSLVVPRPVAWVSTLSAAGLPNLAAFSYFNAASTNPPLVMFSVGVHRDGRTKDTLNNLREVPEFVLHIANTPLIAQVEITGTEFAPEVNEFEEARLTAVPATLVRPARVAEAPAAMECRVLELHPMPIGKNTLVIGQVLCFHVRADLLSESLWIDTLKLDPISRLARKDYGKLGAMSDGQSLAEAFRRAVAPNFD
ncbi:MAG: flavin reductase family protein [Candidatus Thermofonsia Clade 1 bacterium]|jgi:flavin reductase (DIM6/NTAB) family NADH-FMN oxidoreductase RutF|uniref:Flavin reductase family protein n=1 Tax=Candidatus Thermofonsia Clade 1 bacterium TaxID=2364210 RepID=A0A2M8PGB2_9CHLR|nr:MAG: flavin reductase family protein [Candidatus Thermofonsia Clade 1 bacterium]RMF52765.1 MAG: flavin reductase family protein [Chloroflexota bacterium]